MGGALALHTRTVLPSSSSPGMATCHPPVPGSERTNVVLSKACMEGFVQQEMRIQDPGSSDLTHPPSLKTSRALRGHLGWGSFEWIDSDHKVCVQASGCRERKDKASDGCTQILYLAGQQLGLTLGFSQSIAHIVSSWVFIW